MATFVLVHGGCDGGWHWRPIVRLLQAAGHDAFPITLTGLGERVHLASPQVTLSTHIADVVNTLRFEQLEEVILTGHSYGGMVITGVAEVVPERLSHLVHIDAFVPKDGQSMWDILGSDVRAIFEDRARMEGSSWLVPFDPPDGWQTHRRVPLPTSLLGEPLPLCNPTAAAHPRTYIGCTESEAELGPLGPGLVDAAHPARADSTWQYRKLPTGHSPMETMPNEWTDVLLGVEAAGTRTDRPDLSGLTSEFWPPGGPRDRETRPQPGPSH